MENPFDLRAFLAKIDAAGQLRTITGAALDTEVGALTELNGQRQGPALLFGGCEGYPAGYRVLSGAMLNAATFGAALGVDAESDNLAMLRTVSGVMKEVAGRAKDFPVEYVDDGPILENYFEGDDVDVTRFPVPLWHPDDGGRYIGTGCINVHADPDTGWVNLGTRRALPGGARARRASAALCHGSDGRALRRERIRMGGCYCGPARAGHKGAHHRPAHPGIRRDCARGLHLPRRQGAGGPLRRVHRLLRRGPQHAKLHPRQGRIPPQRPHPPRLASRQAAARLLLFRLDDALGQPHQRHRARGRARRARRVDTRGGRQPLLHRDEH
ncbi:MAG: UbiD family decarboxylase [Firmicutes bacterium]|nr:UbiD family decarboxylase [Bacillota bacterium]